MSAKFKISQLAAKPIKVELVHPIHGDTGIFVTIVGPQSTAFQSALKEYQALGESATEEDYLRLLASTIVGWEAEDFEEPYSTAAALAFVLKPENTWVTLQLTPKADEFAKFFQ